MLHQHQMNYDRVSGLELEFRTLGTLRNLNSRCDVGNLPINRPKNRTAMIVPFDSTRVVLQMIPTVEGSDYVNASWIDGYTQRNAYIATQAPLPNTVSDFWRMVWEQESSIIAMLNSSNEFAAGRHQEIFCQYWPSESSSKFGSIVVEPVAEYNMTQYVLREFKMTDTLMTDTLVNRIFADGAAL
uniref:Tyrosine-protein phosphatase domain-containing protein n=1 Tax=Steinernema glaseri TaxID=37863 RepID=A0A1I7ZUX3_9BILA